MDGIWKMFRGIVCFRITINFVIIVGHTGRRGISRCTLLFINSLKLIYKHFLTICQMAKFE